MFKGKEMGEGCILFMDEVGFGGTLFQFGFGFDRSLRFFKTSTTKITKKIANSTIEKIKMTRRVLLNFFSKKGTHCPLFS
jgi:hypothetical protein